MDANSFIPHIEDMLDSSYSNSKPEFFGFLTAEEAANALAFLKNKTAGFAFYGGYDNAERTVLCCYPEWCENPQYPISALTFTYRQCDKLSHRDFLGSLMALGIKRESVGDILVGIGKTVVFLKSEIADYVASQIEKIGRTGVNITKDIIFPLPQMGGFTEHSATISSNRLDSVIAALIGTSRNGAQVLISDGLVSVNSFLNKKHTAFVGNESGISVRGKGKFIITSIDDTTKKGRIILKYKKFN